MPVIRRRAILLLAASLFAGPAGAGVLSVPRLGRAAGAPAAPALEAGLPGGELQPALSAPALSVPARLASAIVTGVTGASAGSLRPQRWDDARNTVLRSYRERRADGTFVVFVDGGVWASGKSSFAADLARRFEAELGKGNVMSSDEDGELARSGGSWIDDFDAPLFNKAAALKPAVLIYALSGNNSLREKPIPVVPSMVAYVRATEPARLWNFIGRQAEAFKKAPWFDPSDDGTAHPAARRLAGLPRVQTKLDAVFEAGMMLVQSPVIAVLSRLNYIRRLFQRPPDLIVANSLTARLDPRNRRD